MSWPGKAEPFCEIGNGCHGYDAEKQRGTVEVTVLAKLTRNETLYGVHKGLRT